MFFPLQKLKMSSEAEQTSNRILTEKKITTVTRPANKLKTEIWTANYVISEVTRVNEVFRELTGCRKSHKINVIKVVFLVNFVMSDDIDFRQYC